MGRLASFIMINGAEYHKNDRLQLWNLSHYSMVTGWIIGDEAKLIGFNCDTYMVGNNMVTGSWIDASNDYIEVLRERDNVIMYAKKDDFKKYVEPTIVLERIEKKRSSVILRG